MRQRGAHLLGRLLHHPVAGAGMARVWTSFAAAGWCPRVVIGVRAASTVSADGCPRGLSAPVRPPRQTCTRGSINGYIGPARWPGSDVILLGSRCTRQYGRLLDVRQRDHAFQPGPRLLVLNLGVPLKLPNDEIQRDAAFLRRLNEEIGDSPFASVRPEIIAARMHLERWDVYETVERLLRAELIEQHYNDEVQLTDAGRREAALLLSSPEMHGDAARSSAVVNIQGDAYGVQAATVGTIQYVAVNLASECPAIEEFLAALSDKLDELEISDDQRAAMRADLETAQAQLRSPHPREKILREILSELRAVILGMAGSGAWAGLAELAQHVHV
jgi:DNA-binding MarR family transcriptional regulator